MFYNVDGEPVVASTTVKILILTKHLYISTANNGRSELK